MAVSSRLFILARLLTLNWRSSSSTVAKRVFGCWEHLADHLIARDAVGLCLAFDLGLERNAKTDAPTDPVISDTFRLSGCAADVLGFVMAIVMAIAPWWSRRFAWEPRLRNSDHARATAGRGNAHWLRSR
jgi:hypothetical protein